MFRQPGDKGKGEKMTQRLNSMPMIRQCVTPGMMILHKGLACRVLVVINEWQRVYLRAETEILHIDDCVVEVLLDGRGEPLIH